MGVNSPVTVMSIACLNKTFEYVESDLRWQLIRWTNSLVTMMSIECLQDLWIRGIRSKMAMNKAKLGLGVDRKDLSVHSFNYGEK